VGDSFQRDVQCGRRAEVAKVIVMRSERTDREDPAAWPAPDAIVDDGHGIIELLTSPPGP